MKRIISAILASVMLSGTAAGAIEIQKDWVNVSAWAYNDVSNFTNEGFIPDSFEGINDYRTDITREQFAELTYSVYTSVYDTAVYSGRFGSGFTSDTENAAVKALYAHGIIEGDIQQQEDEPERLDFRPSAPITREDAAVIICRAGNYERGGDNAKDNFPSEDYRFKDDGGISDYAKFAVYTLNTRGIVSGTGGDMFSPKSSVTIEQAICMLYRLSQCMPATPKADGANIEAKEETEINSFSNGFTETKLNETLLIKKDGKTAMSFDTDIYFTLDCVSFEGTDYIFARNFKKRTEVYNAADGKLLFTIPCPVKKAEGGKIFTVSDNRGQYLCGLYDFDGNELLPNKYSEYEVNCIIENGMEIPSIEKQEADGVIYYSDWHDGGRMYRMDSNGDNKTLIVDADCYNTHYIDGRLYFSIRGDTEDCLYTVSADGGEIIQLTDKPAKLISNTIDGGKTEYTPTGDEYIYYLMYTGDRAVIPFYDEQGIEQNIYSNLWRCRLDENGEPINEKVSDINLRHYAEMRDGKVYFMDALQYSNEQDAYLYCFDGKEVKKLSDLKFMSFTLLEDRIRVYIKNTNYDMDFDGSNLRESTEYNQKLPQMTLNIPEDYALDATVSGDGYNIFTSLNGNNSYFTDPEGNKTVISEEYIYHTFYRIGNTLFYNLIRSADKNGLYMYDMENKKCVRLTDNVRYYMYTLPEDNNSKYKCTTLVYEDYYHNLFRITEDNLTPVQVYPNAGLNKYGEYGFLHFSFSNSLPFCAKVSPDGIYTRMTDDYVRYYSYVVDNQEIESGSGAGN